MKYLERGGSRLIWSVGPEERQKCYAAFWRCVAELLQIILRQFRKTEQFYRIDATSFGDLCCYVTGWIANVLV